MTINLNPLATVQPADATNKTIVFSLKAGGINDCGGSLSASSPGYFRATSAGTCEITMTIADGLGEGTPYIQDFTIKPITGASITVGTTAYTPSNKAYEIQKAELVFTVKAPSDKDVYGFRTGVSYPGGDFISLDLAALKIDNASLGPNNKPLLINEQLGTGVSPLHSDVAITRSYDYIGVESDGTNPLILAGQTITIKATFTFANYHDNVDTQIGNQVINFGEQFSVATSADRVPVLFTDSSLRLADLLPGEGQTSRQKIDILRDQAVSTTYNRGLNSKLATLNGFATYDQLATVRPTGASVTAGTVTAYQGETVLTTVDATKITKAEMTLTIKAPENHDVYGFRSALRYPKGTYIQPDLAKLASDNASLGPNNKSLLINEQLGAGVTPLHSTEVESYDYIGVESDGVNPLILAGQTITIKLTFNFEPYVPYQTVVGENYFNLGAASAGGVPDDGLMLLFTDSSVRLSDLLADDPTSEGAKTARQKIDILRDQAVSATSTNGPNTKVAFLNPRAVSVTTVAPTATSPASVTVTHPDYAGGSEAWITGNMTRDWGEEVLLQATIKAPSNNPVYGFQTTLVVDGTYLTLDKEALALDNSGITGLTINPGALATQTVLSVDSDGTTPFLAAGESLTLKLKLSVNPAAPGNRTVGVGSSIYQLANILFLDPTIRKADVDTAAKVTAASGVMRIEAIAGVSQRVTTTANKPHPLINGEYWLSTLDDLIWFAQEVNSGNNAINGSVRNDIDGVTTAAGFVPIGTPEHPFIGRFGGPITSSGGTDTWNVKTITIDLVASGNDGTGLFGVIGDGETEGIEVGAISVKGSIDGGVYSNIGGFAGVVNKLRSFNIWHYVNSQNRDMTNYTNTQMDVSITSTGDNIGGVFGQATGIESFRGAYNTAAIQGGSNVGGFAGTLVDCQAASITVGSPGVYNRGNISGVANVGGIAGYAKDSTLLFNAPANLSSPGTSYYLANSGTVTASSDTDAAGGVVGKAEGTAIINAANVGQVTGGIAGGIVGWTTGTGGSITISWNNRESSTSVYNGLITATGSEEVGAAGGIVGLNEAVDLTLAGNASLAPVVAVDISRVGGIVGVSNELSATSGANYYGLTVATYDAAYSQGVSASLLVLQKHAAVLNGYAYTYTPPIPDDIVGDGSAENPYQITTAQDIIWFAYQVNSNVAPGTDNQINAILMNDVDLTASALAFSGIGGNTSSTRYGGLFDGNGKTITVASQTGALFLWTEGAIIRNLTVQGTVDSFWYAAAIAGTISNTLIENCVNNASVTSANSAAGIVMTVDPGSLVKNCTNNGVILSSTNNAGGIAINIGGGSIIDDCLNTGSVTGARAVGGIAASSAGGNILNSRNDGAATFAGHKPGAGGGGGAGSVPTYVYSVGGILGTGIGLSPTTVDSCLNTGTVSGTANNLGGILGGVEYNQGNFQQTVVIITNCENRGDVISTYDDPDAFDGMYGAIRDKISVGGIAGNLSEIVRSDNPSNISGNTNSGNINGGLAPSNQVGSITGTGGDRFVGNNSTTVLTEKDMGDSKIVYIGPGDDPRIVPTTPTTPTNPGTPYIPGDLTPAGNTDTDTPSTPTTGATTNAPSSPTAPRTSTPATTTAPQPDVAPDPATPLVGTEVVSTRPAQTFIEYVIDNPLLIPVGILALALIVGGAAFAYVRFKRNTEDSTGKHGS